MAEKKPRRYAVEFEHFENAMLTEANLSWQLYMRDRHKMPVERRDKITAMLRRLVAEMKPDLDAYKEEVRLKSELSSSASMTPPSSYPNGN